MYNYSSNIDIKNLNIRIVKAAKEETYGDYVYGTTNQLPEANNLFIDSGLFNISLINVDLDKPQNMEGYPYKANSYSINSQVHFN